MKICIYGAGAIGGYLGVQLAARRRRRQPGRARRASRRDARERAQASDRRRRARGASALHRQSRRARPQDFVIICLKAHSITGVIEQMRAAARAAHPHRHRGQRHPLLVFLQAWRPLRGLDAGEHRSRRPAMARTDAPARHRLHRLSRHRDRGARRDPPRLWRPLSARRALGRNHRRRAAALRRVRRRPACRRRCSIASATRSG